MMKKTKTLTFVHTAKPLDSCDLLTKVIVYYTTNPFKILYNIRLLLFAYFTFTFTFFSSLCFAQNKIEVCRARHLPAFTIKAKKKYLAEIQNNDISLTDCKKK